MKFYSMKFESGYEANTEHASIVHIHSYLLNTKNAATKNFIQLAMFLFTWGQFLPEMALKGR